MPLQKRSAILEARKLCRSVMDAVNDVILVFDPRSFRILDANKRAIQVYGYSRREMVRKEMRDLTDEVPDYSDLVHATKSV
ncbi:MAG TPA: PAS domain-containing protein, partial [Candidatus Angelobacter sp.]|nr:PAS domain-containing protein [Candidatus Angelobacter sp.]